LCQYQQWWDKRANWIFLTVLAGHKKNLPGRMWPAGRYLPTPDLKESGLRSACFTRYWSCLFCQTLHTTLRVINRINSQVGFCSTKSFTVWNIFDNEYSDSRNKFRCVQWDLMLLWNCDMLKCGYESLRTRDKKCLCWRNPAGIYPTGRLLFLPDHILIKRT
jgi:hypothetical protein